MTTRDPSHPWQPGQVRRRRDGTTMVRYAPETVASVLSALATASYAEVGVAFGITRGSVASIVRHARMRGVEVVTAVTSASRTVTARPPRPVVAKATKPRSAPRPVDAAPRAPSVPVAPAPAPVGPFGSGVTLLASTRRQCRAMDDAGECCAAPTTEGSSWCPAHRALYVGSKVAA